VIILEDNLVRISDKIREQFETQVKEIIEKFKILPHGSPVSQVVFCKIKKGLEISPEKKELFVRYLKTRLGQNADVIISKQEKVDDSIILTLLLASFEPKALNQINEELKAP